ncbi:hypothetical protein E2C01_021805 [Portunus trituberculatus]|uniref:Uncharacterized protein n=1 Tax=Portunus trituberculatus TaxID=210409 RepID=A0A5B7E5W6_PORTR|nr:hypothetical protein [Portunus trituberculatus]
MHSSETHVGEGIRHWQPTRQGTTPTLPCYTTCTETHPRARATTAALTPVGPPLHGSIYAAGPGASAGLSSRCACSTPRHLTEEETSTCLSTVSTFGSPSNPEDVEEDSSEELVEDVSHIASAVTLPKLMWGITIVKTVAIDLTSIDPS